MTEPERQDAEGASRARSASRRSAPPWTAIGWVGLAVTCTYLLVSGIIGILLKG